MRLSCDELKKIMYIALKLNRGAVGVGPNEHIFWRLLVQVIAQNFYTI